MSEAVVHLTRKVGSSDWKRGEVVRHNEAGVWIKHGSGLDKDTTTFYPAHMIEKVEYPR